jgi:hypothetical protein
MAPAFRFVGGVTVGLLAGVAADAGAQPVQWAGNGHFYEFVPVAPAGGFGVRWDDARAAALARRYQGRPGYLVTISSAGESAFLSAQFATNQTFAGAWTGGYEPGNDGHWFWADGPEAGHEYWNNNTRTAFPFANWGGIEPNNLGVEENYMAFYMGPEFQGFGRGAWYDSPRTPPFSSDPQIGFIVEYDACGSADFNGDGDLGTDADIEAFFACLSGNCCATCGSADFNGDGDLGTDADIESFFRVLAGGAC